MSDRQTLSHELESLHRTVIVGTPVQRYSYKAGFTSGTEQGSLDTLCNVKKTSETLVKNDCEF